MPVMLQNVIKDNELPITSNVAYHEVLAESCQFTTTTENQMVDIQVVIPFTVHQTIAGQQNGAFRVYLDGDAYITIGSATQWNGQLLINGGAWCFSAILPTDGRCSGIVTVTIPTVGAHTIYTQYSGSTTVTIGTLRSRRRYQVKAY